MRGKDLWCLYTKGECFTFFYQISSILPCSSQSSNRLAETEADLRHERSAEKRRSAPYENLAARLSPCTFPRDGRRIQAGFLDFSS